MQLYKSRKFRRLNIYIKSTSGANSVLNLKLDILFLHPPSKYDFRKKAIFSGPIAETVPHSTNQFIMFPVGLLSIAEYLERNGYKARVINLAEAMINNSDLNVETYLRELKASVYAIDLHWLVHSQGSIEISRLCKKVHPNSIIVLGGLTATRFSTEILREFDFIDIIVRGESERPMLSFMRELEGSKNFDNVPNLTYRTKSGAIKTNELEKPPEDLDLFDFTRLDLVIPNERTINWGYPPQRTWNIPICRGCIYNCITCGGSSYSYRTFFGREKPAFRSPKKIVEDIVKLSEQKIKLVFAFQDPRMGGTEYQRNLIEALKMESLDTHIAMDLFTPTDDAYLQDLKETKVDIELTFSVESGVDHVRYAQGRDYSNNEIIDTLKNCRKRGIRLQLFFMIGLAEDNWQTLSETFKFCEKVYQMDREMRKGYQENNVQVPLWFNPVLGPMVLLDPGSLAFDFPNKYGYNVFYRSFMEIYSSMSMPSWHQWLNYETKYLTKAKIIQAILLGLNINLTLREKYAVIRGEIENPSYRAYLNAKRFDLSANYILNDEIDKILQLENVEERERRLKALEESFRDYSNKPWTRETSDTFGYRHKFSELVHKTIGLLTGN